MNDAKTKQQIVEKITGSTNVLVTVSNDPSVDALSAAIALTVMLNKLAKHTTAIFSGAMPPAITFLDPGKTFESSIDGLRDFIIALDKEKADHLRYKVEGDSVKIFITPYKTTLSDADLEFSQGDYNVELVLALGVENQAHLDTALEAHGSILHDATVITISNQDGTSSLGSIDWRDNTASSLSEMLVGLSELLTSETPLIDGEVSTALLTGIVAETDRFSNPKTSSKVMTIAAQLMAAGADQQLIASKLQESHEIGAGATPTGNDSGYTQPLSALPQPVKDGLAIDHPETTPPVVPAVLNTPVVPSASGIASAYALEPTNEAVVAPTVPPAPAPVVALLPAQTPTAGKIADAYALDPEEEAVPAAAPATPAPLGGVPPAPADVVALPLAPPPVPEVVPTPAPVAAPTLPVIVPDVTTPLSAEPVSQPASAGGLTLTPPSEEIGKHSYLGGAPSFGAPVNSAVEPTSPQQSVDIFAHDSPPTESNRDEAARTDALAAVNASYNTPTPAPQGFPLAPGITLPPPPPLPDFGALPTPAVSPAPLAPSPELAADSPYALDALPQQPAQQPAILGDILAPSAPASTDPGQFKIPGQ
ncbi:hypothetical protein BH10PAT4_BH10PAT4_3730 [soil metagenome]